MFKELLQGLKNVRTLRKFDPATLNDAVAMATDWSPMARGGANFKTHKLKRIHAQRVEFKATLGMLMFGGIFLAIGIGVTVAFMVLVIQGINDTQVDFQPESWILLIFTVAFGGAGCFILRKATTPTVFDQSYGYFCRNRKKPEHSIDPSRLDNYATLESIHALQIISERCSSKNSSYRSFELNLVLEDATRLHVVDHGKQSDLRRDARTLADFLGKPLWDTTVVP